MVAYVGLVFEPKRLLKRNLVVIITVNVDIVNL